MATSRGSVSAPSRASGQGSRKGAVEGTLGKVVIMMMMTMIDHVVDDKDDNNNDIDAMMLRM